MNAADLPLGLIPGLPFADYLAVDALSNSALRLLAKSPAHFYGWKLDPNRPPEPDRGGQLAGELMHTALFEPEAFPGRYPVGPSVSRATKVWKDFCAQYPAQKCIQIEQADAAFGQAASLRAKLQEVEATSLVMSDGRSELSGFWRDQDSGLLCKFRADREHIIRRAGRAHSAVLFDGKTYSDASAREFARQVGRKGYYRQAAWYSEGYYRCTGIRVERFVFGVVETEWPYVASLYVLDEEAMAVGRSECAELLRIYAECRVTGRWPGYAHGIQPLSLPSYMTNNPDELEISYA